MSIEMGPKTSDINIQELASREKWVRRLGHVFRSEVKDPNNSLDLAKQALRRGDGLIIASTHFSRPDPVHAMIGTLRQTELMYKKIIAPIAVHQDNPIYHWLGNKTGVKLMPIVTENTRNRKKYKDRKLNEGGQEYLDEAVDGLANGRIIYVSPQGERMSHLGHPEKPTLGTLMIEAKRKRGNVNYSILFVAFEIIGTKDYSKKRGFNLADKYIIHIGAILTGKQILELAGGKFKAVDQIAYDKLGEFSPEEYK